MKLVSSAVLSAFTQATVWPRSKPYLTKNESAQTPVRVAALVEYVKVCRNDGIEVRNIVRTCGSEYCAHCVFNLSLPGRVAHLSFFERWDSTRPSRLGFVDSAGASQVLYFSGRGEDEKEARRCMSPRLPPFAKNKGAKVGQPATLTEVKNVSVLSYTQQLRDYTAYSQQTGRIFELWVRPSTRMSRPLQQAIENGLIVPKDIPGVQ
jgi:hypothetical protein